MLPLMTLRRVLFVTRLRLRREGLPAFWFRGMTWAKREIVGNSEVVDGEEKIGLIG